MIVVTQLNSRLFLPTLVKMCPVSLDINPELLQSTIPKQQLLKNNFKMCFQDSSIKTQIFSQFLTQNYFQVSKPSAFKAEKITF